MAESKSEAGYKRLVPAGQERQYRLQRRIELARLIFRYVSWGLILVLVVLMIALIRMSVDSARMVEELLASKLAELNWREFAPLKNYYRGIQYVVPEKENIPQYPGSRQMFAAPKNVPITSFAYSPYPDYTSKEYLAQFEPVQECFPFANSTVRIPPLQAYRGVPAGTPDPIIGSYSELGLESDVCFDRFGRFGPYGFGYTTTEGGAGRGLYGNRAGADKVWADVPQVDYTGVNWGDAQDRCFDANRVRFGQPSLSRRDKSDAKTKLKRTVILFRTWHKYRYKPEDIINLRAMISELSIMSGGEYTVHLLVHVKDENLQIWASKHIYEVVLNQSVPLEFRNMATLWSEKQMSLIYPGLEDTLFEGAPVHGVYRSSFMPVQYFASNHPEFDFFWNWELDVRSTGHFYEIFDRLAAWTRKQPRKGLWERSSRFWIPSVHGDWRNYSAMVSLQTERIAMRNGLRQTSDGFIWGAAKFAGSETLDHDNDPQAPWPIEQDRNEWGVGEDADLITLNPLFNPDRSGWILAGDTTGYNRSLPTPPRRTAIVATSRLSRRLLATMHDETAFHRHTMATEMWPVTAALHHGMKVVYAPHPMYVDRHWPEEYLNKIFNGGDNLVPGGGKRCVFGEQSHQNLAGTSWYYNAKMPRILWRRWLGMPVEKKEASNEFEKREEANGGRMCLRSMLLHPIKDA